MEENEISKMTDKGESNFTQNMNGDSEFFKKEKLGGKDCKYYEIINKDKRTAKLIFLSREELVKKADDYYQISFDPNKYDEIILIFDFNNLAGTLDTNKFEILLKKFIEYLKNNENKTKLSLIIQNCLIEDKEYEQPLLKDLEILHLNKLVISDELYSFSPYIKTLFSNIKAQELTLKKFKFNSKAQLSDFASFIISSSCEKLTLDDFFIELIIKKDENDDEYNDLDIYFSLLDNFIVINNVVTDIKSLTLRDCPLFAIIGDIFSQKNMSNNIKKSIDIDQNSLLNPGIITKFKMENGKCDICFDLDSYKIKLEEEEKNNCDYINLLFYIFNILVPSLSKNNKDYIIDDIEDSGVKDIPLNSLHKLVFKNFDMTKLEYITGDDVTYIDEEDWVLNEEEKEKKQRFESFDKILRSAGKRSIPSVKELVFDNCSNYFIDLVFNILKGGSNIKTKEYQFDLLKIKKCGNSYVDISRILKWKINKLILFDTPLIIGSFPEKSNKHLDSIRDKLGSVDYLTIKINSLDCYGREYNLNVMKTYEILIELIECENFNKNLIFEMNALSSIMTYLAYVKYVKDQNIYNDPNGEEDGEDDIKKKGPVGEGLQTVFEEDVKYLPKYIFFSSKKFRDYLCSQAFKLNLNLPGPITIKNTTIKKCYENYENQNYLLYKIQQKKIKDKKPETKIYTTNKELRKMDFGSDGFYIERDYKYFFFENNIKTVKLENVGFSNFKDNNIEAKNNREFETINNLIGKNLFGESIGKYSKMNYPSYIMDMKTFNGIFCINYGYENVTEFFKTYIYKTTKEEDKESMYYDIKCIKSTFEKFVNNIKNLCIIINNIKEQKEFYCLAVILNFLITPQFIKDTKSSKPIPEKNLLEKRLTNYFTFEKNENDYKVYSELDYYNISPGEEKMVKNKKIEIGSFSVDIDIRFDYFEEYI